MLQVGSLLGLGVGIYGSSWWQCRAINGSAHAGTPSFEFATSTSLKFKLQVQLSALQHAQAARQALVSERDELLGVRDGLVLERDQLLQEVGQGWRVLRYQRNLGVCPATLPSTKQEHVRRPFHDDPFLTTLQLTAAAPGNGISTAVPLKFIQKNGGSLRPNNNIREENVQSLGFYQGLKYRLTTWPAAHASGSEAGAAAGGGAG